MADKVAETKPVESTVEDVAPEKAEKVKPVEDKDKEEVIEKEEADKNGDAKSENGDSKEEIEPEDKPEKNGGGDDVDAATDKCCIKRKSTGAEVQDVTPAEGATPEKKAKLDETAEAEVAA